MKQLLIASFDMEVGGVERSLISLLNHLDYQAFDVDLMLYSHTGDFMSLLPHEPNLLPESERYKTFRMSIRETLLKRHYLLALTRLLAKLKSGSDHSAEKGFKQMQYMWKYALPFLPAHKKEYDVAISYLWPHYFVAEKVVAKKKIAWIHTDFSTVSTDEAVDIQMWKKFDQLVAVSDECKNAFVKKYPQLAHKVEVIENISSPNLVKKLAQAEEADLMINDNRFKILTVARLSYAKGIDNAVKALRLLHDRGYKDIAWYVIGYGGDESYIKELISENRLLDSFLLLGKKLNPFPYMTAADLYVQPSRYEGKAVTVGEAQILAKPVLITNYPTAKSQLDPGVDGVICEQSIEGLANGIERLYLDHNSRQQLTQNCLLKNYNNKKDLQKLYEFV